MEEKREYILTKEAPEPGSYSQAVSVDVGGAVLVFLAGQTGNIPGVDGEPVISGGIGPQTTQTLENIAAVVKVAGGRIDDIVELKVFLKDGEGAGDILQHNRAAARKTFNAAYVDFFRKHGRSKEANNLPARTMVWVPEVPLEFPTEDTVVEITAMAVITKKGVTG